MPLHLFKTDRLDLRGLDPAKSPVMNINVAGKIRFQVEPASTYVKLVILIFPRLNTHSDGLKKLF